MKDQITILTIAIASSTSSLFLPATRPLKDSSASLSFFRRTCFSNDAASLSLACISPSEKKRKEKKKKIIFESFDFIENSHSYSFTTVESNNKESSNTWVQQTIKGIKLFPNSIYTSLQKEIQERENSKTSHHFALVQGYIGSINRK